MTDQALTERQKSFFDLPRELRDMVYDNLKCTYSASQEYHLPGAIPLIETIAMHARLVNRQFNQELDERVRQDTKLILRSCNKCFRLHPLKIVPSVSKIIAEIEIKLKVDCLDLSCNRFCFCCDIPYSLYRHRCWIENLTEDMPILTDINVRTDVAWSEDEGLEELQDWPKSPHMQDLDSALEDFVKMKSLNSVKVHKWPTHAEHDHQNQYEVWVSWDKQNGWQAPPPRQGGAL